MAKATVQVSIADAKPEDYDALLILVVSHLTIYAEMQKDVTAHLLNTSLKMLFQHLQFAMVH